MSVKLKHMIFILLTAVSCSIINFNAYLKGSKPDLYQLLTSVLFTFLWFLYGLFMSYREKKYFIKLSTLYWGIGALLCTIGYFGNLFIYIPAAFIFAGPIYGIEYFLEIPTDIRLVLISIAIPYGLSMIGYWIGKGFKTKIG